jgi:CBS domain containing-hemolysin-like protein
MLLKVDREELATLVRKKKGWAERASSMVERPEAYLGLTFLATELFFLWGGVLILALSVTAWGWGWAVLATIVFWVVNLVVGELLPGHLTGTPAIRLLPVTVFIMEVFRFTLWPWHAIERLAVRLSHQKGVNGHLPPYPLISRQALSRYMVPNEEEGKSPQPEREMIQRIFTFSETSVKEVMIPLVEVQAVEEGSKVIDVIRKVERFGFSRFPVYKDRIDNMVGIVHSFDCLGASSVEEPVLPYIRSAPFVPETMPADDLMVVMQRAGHHMALVVDEYGGSVGIVTLEDLLEEIVGEIEDEHDIRRVEYQKLSSRQYILSARMEIEQVNDLLGVELPKEDYETLGGFLLKAFRRIPKEGETLNFKGLTFTIQKADPRSVKEVLVTRPSSEEEDQR